MSFRLDIREGELDLTIDTTRTDEGGVEGFDLVGRHNDFDVASRVESV